MASRSKPTCWEPTDALRARSPERLLAALARFMLASEPNAERDYRDVLVGFAPYLDCARRLGSDPVDLFDTAAADAGPAVRELAAAFARRSAVTLRDFGWRLDQTPDGPCYKPTG